MSELIEEIASLEGIEIALATENVELQSVYALGNSSVRTVYLMHVLCTMF